jgi:hypothetical protein
MSDERRARERERQNARARARRQQEVAERRQLRLEQDARRRSSETTAQREQRLEYMRAYAAARSAEQLAARAAAERDRHAELVATETDEQRERRLRETRAAERERRAAERAERDALLASDERLRELAAGGVPVPLDDATREAIARDANAALWRERMDEAACAVCDELVVLAELHELELRDDEALVAKMRARLAAPADLRALPALLAHYRVAAPGVANFDDVLLSPRGVVHWASPNFAEHFEPTRIRVCSSCRRDAAAIVALAARPRWHWQVTSDLGACRLGFVVAALERCRQVGTHWHCSGQH